MRITVIGAGAIGAAIARELLTRDEVTQVQVCDKRARALQELHNRVDNPALRSFQIDARDISVLNSILRGSACAIGCISPKQNLEIARTCVNLGIHFCDLGGNDQIVEKQLKLHEEARVKSTWVVPNCGLAPGLVNILCLHGIKQFDDAHAAHLRVGDVPRHPEPPFNFRISWSAEKVIDDYTNPVFCIEDGEVVERKPLQDKEAIAFPEPFGTMEAFYTQGGLSTLTRMLSDTLETLDHKSVRWPGHAHQMEFIMGLGFGEARKIDVRTHLTYRDILARRLRKTLGGKHADVVLMRVLIKGKKDGEDKTLAYEMVEHAEDPNDQTAVERCTSLPVVTIAIQLGLGEVLGGGACPPEHILPHDDFVRTLIARGLPIEQSWYDGHLDVTELPPQ